jgi:hypothetical protein
MLLAGIQKKSLDARLRGHDGWVSDTYLSEAVLSIWFKDSMRKKQLRVAGNLTERTAEPIVTW